MKPLRKLFENRDKKNLARLAAILIAGILLLVISQFGFPSKQPPASTGSASGSTDPPAAVTAAAGGGYEQELEQRMEDAFSQVAGVGRVKVLLTMACGEQSAYATNAKTSESVTKETDAQGGERTSTTNSTDESVVTVTGQDGKNAPLVLKTYTPKVQGVIIIAEGGDNVSVKAQLTQAAESILGLEANRVQVLKMKS